MHDIVNDEDLSALAAEYVIGSLDPDERTRANVLLEVDEGFRALVRAWERRLGELHLMVEPVEPDGRIWERVRGRLGIRTPAAPAPFAPAPPPFVPPPPPPFGAPAAEPVRAPVAEPKFESRLEPRQTLESRFESRFELPPAPQLQPAQEKEQEEEVFTPGAPRPETTMPEATTPAALTTEQQLAGLIREADRFSEPRAADTTPKMMTFEPVTIANEPQAEAVDTSQAEAAATTEAEALLEEAAEAIAVKPAEPAEADQVEEAAPAPIVARAEPRPTGASRKDTMLTPADLARVTFRTQERRLETWRAAMLFMTVVAAGLGSLIAAWRYAPEHLPPRLQPNTILGLPELGPSERIPAQHGTQFEE